MDLVKFWDGKAIFDRYKRDHLKIPESTEFFIFSYLLRQPRCSCQFSTAGNKASFHQSGEKNPMALIIEFGAGLVIYTLLSWEPTFGYLTRHKSRAIFSKHFHFKYWKYFEYCGSWFEFNWFLANHDDWEESSTEKKQFKIHFNYPTALHRWSWTPRAKCCSKLASTATITQYLLIRDVYETCRHVTEIKQSSNHITSIWKHWMNKCQSISDSKSFPDISIGGTVYAMPSIKYFKNVLKRPSAPTAVKTEPMMWCQKIQFVPAWKTRNWGFLMKITMLNLLMGARELTVLLEISGILLIAIFMRKNQTPIWSTWRCTATA